MQVAQPVFTLAQDGDRDAVFDVDELFSLATGVVTNTVALVSDLP